VCETDLNFTERSQRFFAENKENVEWKENPAGLLFTPW